MIKLEKDLKVESDTLLQSNDKIINFNLFLLYYIPLWDNQDFSLIWYNFVFVTTILPSTGWPGMSPQLRLGPTGLTVGKHGYSRSHIHRGECTLDWCLGPTCWTSAVRHRDSAQLLAWMANNFQESREPLAGSGEWYNIVNIKLCNIVIIILYSRRWSEPIF